MIMNHVFSSNLDSVGYDPQTQTLRIRFHSGGLYDYHNVPQSIYEQLMTANSKGKYHHRFIKNHFRFTKLI